MAQNDGTGDDFGVYDVRYYRGHFDAHPARPEAHTYEQARSGYELGHTAAANPAYQGRPYAEVEVELERGYAPRGETRWEHVREYARHGYEWRSILGGLALAAGGWWAGKQLADALGGMGEEDEAHYRTHFQALPARPRPVTYDRARTGYTLGHAAAHNPDYRGRPFADVEPELRRGFTGEHAARYEELRDYFQYGYERGVGRLVNAPGLGDNTRGIGDVDSSL